MLSSLLEVFQTVTSSSASMCNGGGGLEAEPLAPGRETERSSPPQDGLLETLLVLDREVSRWLYLCRQGERWRRVCLWLEWSGHGVLWFFICGLFFLVHLLTANPTHLSHAWNMLTLLLVDIVAVAPLKLLFKRSRPPTNSGTILLSVSAVDHYAFPSGHASRALALAAYFASCPPLLGHLLLPLLWWLWALLVSLSRVVGGRHHLLDVLVGMAAGLAVFWITRQFGLLSL